MNHLKFVSFLGKQMLVGYLYSIYSIIDIFGVDFSEVMGVCGG
jgi:hypothetical protein